MKTSNQLLYATGASAAILGIAIYLQEELPVAQSPVTGSELVPCTSVPAASTNPAVSPMRKRGAGADQFGSDNRVEGPKT
ncbi:MAG: hypothetical protein EON58_13720 [Alphaproteobacteria bacterium]|nr:MAG: hypothetical protein EON58_13720 [Alphaproteobacteria bacterium]